MDERRLLAAEDVGDPPDTILNAETISRPSWETSWSLISCGSCKAPPRPANGTAPVTSSVDRDMTRPDSDSDSTRLGLDSDPTRLVSTGLAARWAGAGVSVGAGRPRWGSLRLELVGETEAGLRPAPGSHCRRRRRL